jgi:parallel beta-helix repeat protein
MITAVMILLLIIGALTLAHNVRLVKAAGTVYIRADGSIDPPTTPISSVDNITYTFTDDINDTSLIVERDNIVIDGTGHTIQGGNDSNGISLAGRNHVTIQNIEVKASQHGIFLQDSFSNRIIGSNLTENLHGVSIYSSTNITVSGNNVTSSDKGIDLESSSNSTVLENSLFGNHLHVWLNNSFNNTIAGNNVEEGTSGPFLGIRLNQSQQNTISKNRFHLYPHISFAIWIGSSSFNNILENTIEGQRGAGILMQGSSLHNNVSCNNVTALEGYGVEVVEGSYDNIIVGNSITANYVYGPAQWTAAVSVRYCSNNTITGNNIVSYNASSVSLANSTNNLFYHNNFVSNSRQVIDDPAFPSLNLWDVGYSSGSFGNYWSDYSGTDMFWGSYQNMTGEDTIGDTPYVIDANDKDNYPLILPWIDHKTAYDCTFLVFGTSMAPTILPKDLIWVKNTTDPAEIFAAPYPQGDIIVHKKPDNESVYIVRRAIAKWYENGTWFFTVKSDGGGQEEENITVSLIVGRVVALERRFCATYRGRTFNVYVYSNSMLDGFDFDVPGKSVSINVTRTLAQGLTSYCEVYIPNTLLSGIYNVKIGNTSIPFMCTDYGQCSIVAFQSDQTNYTASVFGAFVGTPPDIAITSVRPSKAVIGQGYTASADVMIENQGDFAETFNVTLYADLDMAVNETGLVGCWRFDENAGTTAYDSSGNGNDGTLCGPEWVQGKNGSALSFDGSDDYVEVPDSPTLNPSAITVMAWVYFKELSSSFPSNNSMIISKGTDYDANGSFCLFATGPQGICLHMKDNGQDVYFIQMVDFVEGEWYHVAGTYDGSEMKIYINGEFTGGWVTNISRTTDAGNLQIGALRKPGEESWLNGTIDEVRIYDRALSKEEIQARVVAQSKVIGRQTTALSNGNSTTIIFDWNTTDFAKGNYTLRAIADTLSGEMDVTDNTCVDGTVHVGIPGDVDPADDYVGIDDIFAIASHFGQEPGQPSWNAIYDIADDNYVGIDDIFIAASHFGQENP